MKVSAPRRSKYGQQSRDLNQVPTYIRSEQLNTDWCPCGQRENLTECPFVILVRAASIGQSVMAVCCKEAKKGTHSNKTDQLVNYGGAKADILPTHPRVWVLTEVLTSTKARCRYPRDC